MEALDAGIEIPLLVDDRLQDAADGGEQFKVDGFEEPLEIAFHRPGAGAAEHGGVERGVLAGELEGEFGSAKALRSGKAVTAVRKSGRTTLTLPSLADYELIALERR